MPNTALYAKGRLGIAKNEIEVDYTDKEDSFYSYNASESETSIAGGLGLGYNITPMASVEVMYNMYPSVEDIDVDGVTLGAHVKF